MHERRGFLEQSGVVFHSERGRVRTVRRAFKKPIVANDGIALVVLAQCQRGDLNDVSRAQVDDRTRHSYWASRRFRPAEMCVTRAAASMILRL